MSWICPKCETENGDDLLYCEVCSELSPKHIEERVWQDAVQDNTEESYSGYLSRFPKGRYRLQAYKRLKSVREVSQQQEDENLWKATIRENTIVAYKNYISKSPLNTHRTEAQNSIENIRWVETVNADTIKAYQSYLSEGYLKHEEQAVQRLSILDDELWKTTTKKDNKDSYNSYLRLFKTTGKHRLMAERRIAEIHEIELDEENWKEAKMDNTLIGYENYIRNSKLKTHIGEAGEIIRDYDNKAWDRAKRENSQSSYKKYLYLFPQGRYADKAKQSLHKIERNKRAARRSLWACVVIIIIIITYKSTVNSQMNSQPVYNNSGNSSLQTKEAVTDRISPHTNTSSNDNAYNIRSSEMELEKKIKGMETAKRYGDPINRQTMSEAEDLLYKLRSSSNYDNYQRRINALKR